MSHSVENGQIKYLSVSQVEKFDATATPWSCPRRWWFRYVAGLPEPQTTAQSAGEDLHKQIEHYLKTGEDVLGPLARLGLAHIPVPGKDLLVEYELQLGELSAQGIPFIGRVDCVSHRNGRLEIIDWKTTSNLKYAKTEAQLRESTQMLGYAKAMLGEEHEEVSLTHVVFQTTKPAVRRISCNLNSEIVFSKWLRVESLAGEMISAARETDPNRVPANRGACQVGRQTCPYIDRCPGSMFVDLFSRFSTPAEILPPDAPKSDPALAADPVPDFEAAPVRPVEVPETTKTAAGEQPVQSQVAASLQPPPLPKRGPGRPRKTESTPASTSAPNTAAVTLDRVTIRKGVKIGLPNYSSAEVSVELGATVTGDPDAAIALLSQKIELTLAKECAAIKAKAEAPHA